MTREVLGFGPFLASLERRLDELPAEQLRRVLVIPPRATVSRRRIPTAVSDVDQHHRQVAMILGRRLRAGRPQAR